MTALVLLFAISFAWVFLMAFQSRNINTGQYVWAAAGSWLIGNLQVAVLSRVIGPGSSFVDVQVYCLGGAAGVTSAMLIHRRLFRK